MEGNSANTTHTQGVKKAKCCFWCVRPTAKRKNCVPALSDTQINIHAPPYVNSTSESDRIARQSDPLPKLTDTWASDTDSLLPLGPLLPSSPAGLSNLHAGVACRVREEVEQDKRRAQTGVETYRLQKSTGVHESSSSSRASPSLAHNQEPTNARKNRPRLNSVSVPSACRAPAAHPT